MRRQSGWLWGGRRGGSLYSLVLRQTLPLQGATILLGLAVPPLAVLPLDLQERLIDEAIPAADMALLLGLAALVLGAHLLRSAIKFSITYLHGWIAAIVTRVLRVALVDAQRRREAASARRSLGAVTSVLTGEVEPLGDFAAEAIGTPLVQGGTLLGVFGYMLATDWRLAAIGIGSLAIEGTITPILQHRINRLTEQRIRAMRSAGGDLIEAAEPGHHRLIVHGLGRIRETYLILLRMNALKALLKVLRNMTDHSADVAIITLGALLVIEGDIAVGVIVAFLSGLREVRGPWGELIGFYRRLADAEVKYRLVRRAVEGDMLDLAAAMAPRMRTAAPVRMRHD